MFTRIFIIASLLVSLATQSQPINSNALFTSPDNYALKLSPNGRFVSVVSRNKQGKFFDLYDRNNKYKLISTRLGMQVGVTDYHWVNDQFIHLKISINHLSKTLILKVKEDKVEVNKLDVDGYMVHLYPEDNNKVLFARKKSDYSRFYNLYLITIADLINNDFDTAKEIKHDGWKVSNFIYDPESREILTLRVDYTDESVRIEHASIDDGKWKVLMDLTGVEYDIVPVGFINDHILAVLTNENTDKVVLQEYNYRTHEFGKIIYQHPKFDLTDAHYSRRGSLSYVSFYQHGLIQRHYFEKEQSKRLKRLEKTFFGNEVYVIDNSTAGDVSLLYVNGSSIPGEYLVYDHKADRIVRFLNAYESLDYTFSPSQTLSVQSVDGTDIEAYLTVPPKNNLNTLLVMPHGGPIGIREYDYFNKTVQYFASRGFSVLRVNFRGSAGFGKAFQKKGVGEFGKLIEQDISLAVSEVLKSNSFDHMCSMGSSYGGYSAVMLAIQNPEQYKCVIGAFGIYDLPLLFNASNYRSGDEFAEGVSKVVGEYSDSLIDVSPVNLVEKLQAPVLLIAGREDDRADFEHSNRFKYLLKKTGKDVRTMFYKDTGHGHSSWYGDRHEAAISYDFLMETLGLDYPAMEDIDTKGQQALANDFALIADELDTGKHQEKDLSRAYDYYLKAANYGHDRSAFNIGAYLHQGDVVEKNTSLAIQHYKKAAELGYQNAYLRLGRIYMEGEFSDVDWRKAKQAFEEAHESEPGAKTAIWLARLLCSAPLPIKDVQRCITLLDVEKYRDTPKFNKKESFNLTRESLAWIFAEGELNEDELKSVQSVAQEKLSLNTLEFSLEDLELGRFVYKDSERFGESGEYEHVEKGNVLHPERNKNERIGLRFAVDVPGINRADDQVAVVARFIRDKNDGSKLYTHYLLYGQPRGDWYAYYNTRNLKSGEQVTFEVYDLHQKKLFSTRFVFPELVPDAETKENVASE